MKKSSAMYAEALDLRLKWDDQTRPIEVPRLKAPFPQHRIEEYFDFLESIGPLPRDAAPAKLYGERFVV